MTAGGRRALPIGVLFGAAFALWGALVGLAPLSDNSFLTHLATGRLVLDGGVPGADPYSYTAPGQEWVVQSWLASVLFAAAERVGGGATIVLLHGALTAGIAALTWSVTRSAEGLAARVVLTGLSLGVATALWQERPLLIGLALLATTWLAADGRVPAWALVPGGWVWANSHGSWPLGLVLLAALAAGARLDRSDRRDEERALVALGAGAALAVVSPLGLDVWRFPVQILDRNEVMQHVIEWQSPSFVPMYQRLFLVLVAVTLVSLVRGGRWRPVVPVVVFATAALLALRNLAPAALVLAAAAAPGLGGVGALRSSTRSAVALPATALVAGVAIVVAVGSTRSEPYDLATYPVLELSWADAFVGPDARLVHDEPTGNLLTAVRGRDAGVFVDDRFDMYPIEHVRDIVTLLRGRPGWDAILAAHEPDAVVWERSSPLTELVAESDRWRITLSSADWIVAMPRR